MAIIAGMISTNSVHPAPVALAKSVTAGAFVKGAAASASILTLIKRALKLMAWTKAKMAIVVGVAAVLAVGTTTTFISEALFWFDYSASSLLPSGFHEFIDAENDAGK
jgi:hypothetical protein